jgi:hypothetical protein
MTDHSRLAAAVIVTAIFACGMLASSSGLAWRLRSEEPEAEPDHETTIEHTREESI